MKKTKYYISYYSESDHKRIKRPYDPHFEKQYEFIANGTGNLCKDTGMLKRKIGVRLRILGKL